MSGLEEGLRAQIPSLRSTLDDITSEIQVGAQITATSRANSAAAYQAAAAFTKGDAASGASVTVNQYYPVAQRDSQVRDDVASGIRLAGALS